MGFWARMCSDVEFSYMALMLVLGICFLNIK